MASYVIKGITQGDAKPLQDGRKWKKNCPTSWKGHARVRFADCSGSLRCTKDKCPFLQQYGVTNTTQFEKKRDRMVCKGCGAEGTHLPCSARRYISYGKNMVTIYHVGDHTCPVRSKPLQKDVKTVEEMVRRNPNIKSLGSPVCVCGFSFAAAIELGSYRKGGILDDKSEMGR